MYNEKLTKLLDDIRLVTLEKDRLTTEYSEGIKTVRIAERDIVTREWDEKMRILKMDKEIMSARYESLETRRKMLEESRDKDIQDAVKRTEELMEKLVASKEDQLLKMETAYTRLTETICKQSEEISKLSGNLIKRSANVKTKGSDYEDEFGKKLKRVYGLCKGFILKNTSGLGHEMDFLMEIEGHSVIWELKNYTSVVPKAEVDKFLRDLKENPPKIGVMISRSTDIYGKNLNDNIHIEFDNDKMMIYINKFEELCGDDETRVFQMLTSLFRIWWEYHREENTFDRVEIVRELEKAVDDISFDVYPGETLGLVGESGCGKTTTGRAILRLVEPTGGDIEFAGKDIRGLSKGALKTLRKDFQIIFQDPYSSLNPRLSVGSAIMEVLKVHNVMDNDTQRREYIHYLLDKVNLEPHHYGNYPHEFSGGQRQRICIARALALKPSASAQTLQAMVATKVSLQSTLKLQATSAQALSL